LQDPVLKIPITHTQKGLVEWLKVKTLSSNSSTAKKPRASGMLGKCSTTNYAPSPKLKVGGWRMGVFLFLFLIFETESLCNPGWPQTCHLPQVSLKFMVSCLTLPSAGIIEVLYHVQLAKHFNSFTCSCILTFSPDPKQRWRQGRAMSVHAWPPLRTL
jgi:hypothetical protein